MAGATDLERRRLLRATAAGMIGATGYPGLAAGSAGGQPAASVTLADQETTGDVLVVDEIVADRESALMVWNEANERVAAGTHRFSAGETATDVSIVLSPPLEADQQITARLYESNGGVIASDVATVTMVDDQATVRGMDVTLIEPDADGGFDYPYFLYAPDRTSADAVPILVEPNNTGTATDDFAEHRDRARETIERGPPRTLSVRLQVPLLVPVFPRPESEPVDWTHYVHQLDRDTLAIDGGDLERVDLQLLAMVDDARARLETDTDYALRERIALDGFSASGNFVDRFAVLHPDRVLSVTAGGLNGMALLPLSEVDGRTLDYHVGITDVESLTGKPVDLDALDDANQFLYMGAEDESDTIPYSDAWTDPDRRDTALAVYGRDMIADRFPVCQAAYERAGVSAQFRVYEGVGHTPQPALDDVVAFHRASMNGESVEDYGEQLPDVPLEADPPEPRAAFDVDPSTPTAGGVVTFDAGRSDSGVEGSLAYHWDFGDGETATEEHAGHAFDSPGTYEVRLRVTDQSGDTDEVRQTITVEPAPDGDEATGDDPEAGGGPGAGGDPETSGGTDGGDEPTNGSDGGETTDPAEAGTADGDESDPGSTGNESATASEGGDRGANDSDPNDADGGESSGSDGTPGFAVGSAVAGIAGAVELLRRRIGSDEE